MLEEVANIWVNVLHFPIDVKSYMPTVPNLWDKQLFPMQRTNNVKVEKLDVILGYVVLFWALLYFLYEKCLNLLLRRMRIPLLQRNRIIEAVWNCGFCVGSICYLKSSVIKSFHAGQHQITYEQLGVILHKSFYFHRAGVEILHNRVWLRGLANLLFALCIINPHHEKWCTVVNTFLFYKAIDTVTINICRTLLCLSHLVGRKLPKIIFWVHALCWFYLYIVFVPKLMLLPEKRGGTRIEFGLWLWFITECFDSVWFRVVGCARAIHWLEICLFPPPTQEAIQLASIQRKYRESLRKLSVDNATRKNQMWQTLMCVMAIKSKVKRIRKAKETEDQHLESMSSLQETISVLNNDVVLEKTISDMCETSVPKMEEETVEEPPAQDISVPSRLISED